MGKIWKFDVEYLFFKKKRFHSFKSIVNKIGGRQICQWLPAVLLFFAAYVICKKNYSFSRIVFVVFLFFQSKNAISFYSKLNVSSGVRTKTFWSGRSGFESLPCQIFLRFRWHLSEFPNVLMAQWVGQQVEEEVGTGSNPSLYLQFFNYINKFRDQNLSETRMGSPTNFSALWDKKFSTEKRDTPHPSIHKIFSIPKIFWNTEGFCEFFFGTVRQKNFHGE